MTNTRTRDIITTNNDEDTLFINPDSNATFSIRVVGNERRLSPEAELALFRISQEALTNVKKHSRATEVSLRLVFKHDKVGLSVIDNGCGFEVSDVLDFASGGRLGLISMQERARSLGSSLLIKSRLGKGTEVATEVFVLPSG